MKNTTELPEYLLPFKAVPTGQHYYRIEDTTGRIFTFVNNMSRRKADILTAALTHYHLLKYDLPELPTPSTDDWKYFYPVQGGATHPVIEGDPYVIVMRRDGEVSDEGEMRPLSYYTNDGKEGNEFSLYPENPHLEVVAYLVVQENPDAEEVSDD